VNEVANLSELIGIERSQRNQTEKKFQDVKNTTFGSKTHIFDAHFQTYKPFVDGAGIAELNTEQRLESSVSEELDFVNEALAKQFDLDATIDKGNLTAVADVLDEDGTVLFAALPATTLLSLEKLLTRYAELVRTIPTLDSKNGFQPAPALGKFAFRSQDVVTTRVERVKKAFEIAKATDKHAAQAQMIEEPVAMGVITKYTVSSRWTTMQKSELLDRVENLLRSVTQARQKANRTTEVERTKGLGEKVFDLLLKKA
jgi:hypothetical protein